MSGVPWLPGNASAARVEAVEAQARKQTFACEFGSLAWRSWGPKGLRSGDAGHRKPPLASPLLLFPGGFGSWRHWISNVGALSEKRVVHCVEPPGLGDSDAPRSSPPDLGELAQAVIEGLNAALEPGERPHLVGFSFGGIVAGRVAADLGSRIASLTLSGSGALGLPRAELPAAKAITPNLLPEELARAYRHNLAGFMLSPGHVDDYAVFLEHESVRRSRLPYGRILASTALRESLRSATCPLGGIWGGNDPFTKPGWQAYRDLFRALRPDCPFEVVPGASHWLMFERPDQYNAALERVLSQYPESGSD